MIMVVVVVVVVVVQMEDSVQVERGDWVRWVEAMAVREAEDVETLLGDLFLQSARHFGCLPCRYVSLILMPQSS